MEKKNSQSHYFVVRNNEMLSYVAYDDIYFFEVVANHRILLVGKKQKINFYGTLKEIEEKVDSRFFRSSKSFIVNIDHIQSINREYRIIMFPYEYEALVSRNNFKKLLSLKKSP